MFIVEIKIKGDSGSTYDVKADNAGVLFCSCPSWKFQKVDPKDRSCKHIQFAKNALRLPAVV
jgi:predicted nucleic acid-binding Zn finger protein